MPAPAVVRSRGPNGTHWFSKTPWKGDIGKGIIPNEIEVDCSFEALEAAIDAFLAEGASMGVPAAKVKAGTAFLIKPGVLQGAKTSPFAGGAAIIPRSILAGKGSASWDGKALIWPRDGADSVRVSGQIAFDGTKGFVFAGMSTFDSNNTRRYARDGVEMNNVENFGWGWCESAAPRVSANAGKAVRNVELKEFGYADKISREGDYGGLGVNATGTVQNLLLEGFDIPAVYHLILVPWKGNAPSDAHSDGWQLFGGQNVTGIVFRDGRAFAATEAAFQNAGYPGLRFDNVEAIGAPTSVRVFPYENNEATDGFVKAFSGSATVVAVNCDLTGSVTKTQFQSGTTGTRISYPWTGATSLFNGGRDDGSAARGPQIVDGLALVQPVGSCGLASCGRAGHPRSLGGVARERPGCVLEAGLPSAKPIEWTELEGTTCRRRSLVSTRTKRAGQR